MTAKGATWFSVCQSYPDILTELIALNIEVIGTMKMDGTSFTAYLKDGAFGVCSRNMELLETDGNAYWKAIRSLDVEQKMRDYFGDRNIVSQGELIGNGIQGNRMGFNGTTMHFFNLYDVSVGKYLSTDELIDFTNKTNLNMVPIVFRGILPEHTTVESLLKMSDELKYQNGLPAEGIVWRPVTEIDSKVLKGRLSVKVVSNVFLEKYKE